MVSALFLCYTLRLLKGQTGVSSTDRKVGSPVRDSFLAQFVKNAKEDFRTVHRTDSAEKPYFNNFLVEQRSGSRACSVLWVCSEQPEVQLNSFFERR